MNFTYWLFVLQQWLAPVMLVSLTTAACVAFRRRPRAWSFLLMLAALFALAGLAVNAIALQSLGTQRSLADGGLMFTFQPALRSLSLLFQILGATCAIAGSVTTLFGASSQTVASTAQQQEKQRG